MYTERAGHACFSRMTLQVMGLHTILSYNKRDYLSCMGRKCKGHRKGLSMQFVFLVIMKLLYPTHSHTVKASVLHPRSPLCPTVVLRRLSIQEIWSCFPERQARELSSSSLTTLSSLMWDWYVCVCNSNKLSSIL